MKDAWLASAGFALMMTLALAAVVSLIAIPALTFAYLGAWWLLLGVPATALAFITLGAFVVLLVDRW